MYVSLLLLLSFNLSILLYFVLRLLYFRFDFYKSNLVSIVELNSLWICESRPLLFFYLRFRFSLLID